MYNLLQNYTFEICSLNICCLHNIFYCMVGYKQQNSRNVISYPCTLVFYCCFDIIFIFIVKSIPADIVSWLGKTILMPNYWPSHSSTMNLRSPKPWDMKHGVTQYFRFTVDLFFVFYFFLSLMCVWLEKTTVLFICVHKGVKSIIFAVFINTAVDRV